MSPSDQTLEPVFSDASSDELGHIEYFLERLAELRDRGLIDEHACDIAVGECRSRMDAIDRAGRYEACMVKSRDRSKNWPKQAIEWAEQAIQIDQRRIDAWRMIVELCWSQEDDQAAIAWCTQGAELFPELQADLARMRAELAPREERRLERAAEPSLRRRRSSVCKKFAAPSRNSGSPTPPRCATRSSPSGRTTSKPWPTRHSH